MHIYTLEECQHMVEKLVSYGMNRDQALENVSKGYGYSVEQLKGE